jgi:hypothetical protein
LRLTAPPSADRLISGIILSPFGAPMRVILNREVHVLLDCRRDENMLRRTKEPTKFKSSNKAMTMSVLRRMNAPNGSWLVRVARCNAISAAP